MFGSFSLVCFLVSSVHLARKDDSEDAVNPSLPADPSRFRRESEPSPGGRIPPALRSPSSFVRRSPRGDVWGDRGAVAVPRVVRWRTVEPVSVGVYGSRHSREESFRRYPHHEHYRAALNNNDVPGTAAAYTQAPNTLVPIFLHIYFFSKLNPIASWIGSNCWYRFTIPIDAYKKRNTRP